MAYAVALDLYLAAHGAVRELIFASSSSSDSAALIVYDAADNALASFALDPAASTVSLTTGNLSLVPVAASVTASASGTASYAIIADDAGTPLIELPCTQGNSALPAECVLNTLNLISGGEVEAMSITLPAGTLLT